MPDELSFGWARLESVFAEPNFRPLIEGQWAELSDVPEPIEPDYARALALEKIGTLKMYTAYRGDRLVGFIQWWMIHPLSHKGVVWAVDGGWYTERTKRDIGLAIRMWRGAEAALREMGVGVMRGHDNGKHPLAPFFARLGFTKLGSQYQKVL